MALSNIRRRKVYIDLDKKREIIFSLNAIAEIEELYKDFDATVDEAQEGSFLALKVLLYVGIKQEDKDLTPEQADLIINPIDKNILKLKIMEALENDFPSIKDIKKIETDDGFTCGDAPTAKRKKKSSIEWEWLYYLGRFILQLSEEEFWNMNLKKLNSIFNEHLKQVRKK
jgi:hypothetical protein